MLQFQVLLEYFGIVDYFFLHLLHRVFYLIHFQSLFLQLNIFPLSQLGLLEFPVVELRPQSILKFIVFTPILLHLLFLFSSLSLYFHFLLFDLTDAIYQHRIMFMDMRQSFRVFFIYIQNRRGVGYNNWLYIWGLGHYSSNGWNIVIVGIKSSKFFIQSIVISISFEAVEYY